VETKLRGIAANHEVGGFPSREDAAPAGEGESPAGGATPRVGAGPYPTGESLPRVGTRPYPVGGGLPRVGAEPPRVGGRPPRVGGGLYPVGARPYRLGGAPYRAGTARPPLGAGVPPLGGAFPLHDRLSEREIAAMSVEEEEAARLGPKAHPDEDTLERFVRGELSRAEVGVVVRHLLTDCPRCVEAASRKLAERPSSALDILFKEAARQERSVARRRRGRLRAHGR
jgi:hypothetical protein